MKVLRFPLTKITLFFITGIVFQYYHKLPILVAFSFCVPLFIVFIVLFFFSNRDMFQRIWFGITLYILSFIIGITTLCIHTQTNDPTTYIHYLKGNNDKQTAEVLLHERLKSSPAIERYVGLVQTINGKKTTGKILINFKKDDFVGKFAIGTHLLLNQKIELHRPPQNPHQFDYGKYLSNKSILSQVYAERNSILVGTLQTNDIFYYSDRIRTKILKNLSQAGFKEKELAVIAALILGQQQDLSPEIRHDYQFAGAIHILSVSGLHVGFILLFINFILGFLPPNKRNSWIKLMIIISALTGFAILAGLSPSVVRSVTMYSFVAIGMHMNRQTNVFHTLLVSVFLILLFEPSFLFDVGFQLSYAALFFILWLQPIFSNFWQPKNKFVNYFWSILTVSFAAQIGTLPLSIFYFHQFPGLFFVTNLIIIPFLSILMAVGVLTMLLAAFGITPALIIQLLQWNIIILNKIIAWIASFEGFIFQDIPLNWMLLLSGYAAIIVIGFWIESPKFKNFVFAVSAILLFQFCYFEVRWSSQNEKELIVFNMRKSTLIAERSNGKISVYGRQNDKTKAILKAYSVATFSKITKEAEIPNLVFFNDQKILIIDSSAVYPKNNIPDILIMRQSATINLDRLLDNFQPKIIVADGSNYKSYVQRWKETCRKRKIPFHVTAETGFFKI